MRSCECVRVEGTPLRTTSEIERIYRSDGSRLWWSLVAFTGNREIASDAVAEAFAQALRRGDDIRDPLAWVWRVAYKIAAAELKRRPAAIEDMRGAVDQNEQGAVELLDVLRRLPMKQRAAVVLHYYADLPVSEIAPLMAISTATVKVHLHRGRARLKKLLEDDEHG
jgi:RNA polymerase sigma-70 factor, ECF subfamily